MPRVPDRDITPNLAPGARFQNTQSIGEARLPGQQVEAGGKAMSNFGQAIGGIEMDMAREANLLRVDDALNKAREIGMRLEYDPDSGFSHLKGFDALNRPEGKPLAEEYGAKYSESIAEIETSLGNDMQRQAFREQSQNILQSFKNKTTQYEGQQFFAYGQSVREGNIKNYQQSVALNYDRPEQIAQDLEGIQVHAKDLARMRGLSAAEGEALARQETSKAHITVIETALQKENVRYADDYFKKHAKNMEPGDIVRVNAALGGELDARLAADTAKKVIGAQADKMITPDADRAFNIALGTESGNKQFGGAGSVAGPGEPTTSKAGAIGAAQVMPGTGPEAAKLAGVEWDEKKFREDADYNRALGKAYFGKQLKDFGGSLAKAYAAYNAGPGALKKAMEKAKAEGKPEGWLGHLPKETQGYVKKNMDVFGTGGGKNRMPTLYDIKQQVREEIGDDSPKRLKLALDHAEKMYEEVTAAKKAEEDGAIAEAHRYLLQNTGSSYNDLPYEIRSRLPPERVDTIMAFSKKLRTGDDSTNMALYNRFTQNPNLLAGLSDDAFMALRPEFSESDFKHFAEQRSNILSGDIKDAKNPSSLNTATIKSAVDLRLRMLGLDPTPKDTDTEAMQRIGGVRKFVNDAVIAAQKGSGTRMNDADIVNFVDDLFAKRAPAREFDFWTFRDNTVMKPLLEMEYGDIPKGDRKVIEKRFKASGVEPTEGEVTDAYRRVIMARQKDKGSY